MPRRKQVLGTDETYHVLNRGVASLPIFNTDKDYRRFIQLTSYYIFIDSTLSYSSFRDLEVKQQSEYMEKLKKESRRAIDIYAFCLMPNHIHFLVRQIIDGGITLAFSKIQNAYAKYINLKNRRAGPLFQSRFKAKRVEKDEILIHISRYIHLNPSTAFLIRPDNLENYEYSSYPTYVGIKKFDFVNPRFILKIVGSVEKYKQFVLNQADYQKDLSKIKHLLLE